MTKRERKYLNRKKPKDFDGIIPLVKKDGISDSQNNNTINWIPAKGDFDEYTRLIGEILIFGDLKD